MKKLHKFFGPAICNILVDLHTQKASFAFVLYIMYVNNPHRNNTFIAIRDEGFIQGPFLFASYFVIMDFSQVIRKCTYKKCTYKKISNTDIN